MRRAAFRALSTTTTPLPQKKFFKPLPKVSTLEEKALDELYTKEENPKLGFPRKGPFYALHEGHSRHIFLDRPDRMNALSLDMILFIRNCLRAYEASHLATYACLKAHPRQNLSSGVDLPEIYKSGKEGTEFARTYYENLYQLVYKTTKPGIMFIPVSTGLTLGAGAGLVLHATYGAVDPNTLMGFPENNWGLFPDCGISYLFSRLESNVGMFLGLTGHVLAGRDTIFAGLAKYLIPARFVSTIGDALAFESTGGALIDLHNDFLRVVHGEALNEIEYPTWSLTPHLETIDRCFSRNSVEEIIEALNQEGTDFAKSVVAKLETRCPVSLKITFRKIREGKKMDLGQCLKSDFISILRCLKEKDFYTAVEYRLLEETQKPETPIDQPKRDFPNIIQVSDGGVSKYYRVRTEGGLGGKPNWSHKSLKDVTEKEVDKYFELDHGEKPLPLPQHDDWVAFKWPGNTPGFSYEPPFNHLG